MPESRALPAVGATEKVIAAVVGWCEVSAAALARPHGILTAQIPEFPFAMEPRQITRWEARKWARAAYELGVRIIGGCCGFEPYLIAIMTPR